MSRYYILDGDHNAVPADLLTWARFVEVTDRKVAREAVGDAKVSTVFLGSDHGPREDGAALIFETMVFGGPLDQEMERYSTWAEAEAGHAAMVARVQGEAR